MRSNGPIFQVSISSVTLMRKGVHGVDLHTSLLFRLPFRMLVRRYGCDLAYTPMIVSESFVLSEKARDVEFTTNDGRG